MIPFLKSVAKAYASRYSDLSEFCFLFPNKRSGTFFLKYLREEMGRRVMLAPEVMAISDFVSRLAGRVVASRLDLIFILYGVYREVLGLPETVGDDESEATDFDAFRSWGETVLSDFTEVDLYLVNPEEIAKNVKDYREIQSNFLTEEQRRVMQEYFGRSDFGDPKEFWRNFDAPESQLSESKQKFLHLWSVMWPLYQKLAERLEKLGLATPGSVYRIALERLSREGKKILPYKKVVAVGFNALSSAEHAIFRELRDSDPYPGMDSFADFFWDATGPVLTAGVNSASKFVKSNIKSFPCPQWALPTLKLSDTDSLPESLAIAASPSNSAQTKITGMMLGDLRKRLSAKEFKEARVAVVLPDENLLLPMLYSMPEGMGDVNLTMGYTLKLTSVVPFVSHLRGVFSTMRITRGERVFYQRNLKAFLAHPFSHVWFGSETVAAINGYIDRRHKSVLTVAEISEFSAPLAHMLQEMNPEFTPGETAEYLDSVLRQVAEALKGKDNAMLKSRLEISHIEVYRDALRRLKEILGEYPVDMKPRTVFRLIDRLLAGETVGFEGEPLKGLQVMGTLETRSIDFDHIFILSCNEKVLPLRARTRSFIPDSLRRAYGMPPANYAEGIFAYYFYRMISRAKSVTMLYDARSGGGMRSGDPSRYLQQLRYLFAPGRVKEEDWKFRLSGREERDASVEKTPEIYEQLKRFEHPGGDRNFSASALNAYRECPVRFFYQTIMGINTDPEPSEFIDAIGQGNILHDVMMKLYLPEPLRGRYLASPRPISAEMIQRLIDDKEGLWRLMTRTVNELHFHLPEEELDRPLTGAAAMIAPQIMNQVIKVLRHDLTLTPFLLYGAEIKERISVPLPSGRVVNFKFAIDRLDEIEVDGRRQLRIVDYKTGSLKLESPDLEGVLHGGYKAEQIFQLFTYAWLLEKRHNGASADDVRLEIYDVNSIGNPPKTKDWQPIPCIGGEYVKSFGEYAAGFREGIEKMMEEIFDAPVFPAPVDASPCSFCRLRDLCHR